MKIETFNYNQVPFGFEHCLMAHCPKADCCLRRYVAVHVPPETASFMVVNPNALPENLEYCTRFLSKKPVCMAWGIKGFLDQIPLQAAKDIRRILIAHFGKTLFYRIQRKEKPVSPEDQEYICNVFAQHGVEQEPRYEYYTYEYRWG